MGLLFNIKINVKGGKLLWQPQENIEFTTSHVASKENAGNKEQILGL